MSKFWQKIKKFVLINRKKGILLLIFLPLAIVFVFVLQKLYLVEDEKELTRLDIARNLTDLNIDNDAQIQYYCENYDFHGDGDSYIIISLEKNDMEKTMGEGLSEEFEELRARFIYEIPDYCEYQKENLIDKKEFFITTGLIKSFDYPGNQGGMKVIVLDTVNNTIFIEYSNWR